MLIGFSVGNFLSFKEVKNFSMIKASITELDESHTFTEDKNLSLLKSAVIYGANASGKTNLIDAMRFMRLFIFTSSKESQALQKIPVTRFKLNSEMDTKPTYFEILFLHNNKKYRYGFELDTEIVHKEWLFYIPQGKNKEVRLFFRDKQTINLGPEFNEGSLLVTQDKIRPNSLLVSVSAQFNGPIAAEILEWFGKFHAISGLHDHIEFTIDKFADGTYKDEILQFITIVDIEDLIVDKKEITTDMLPPNMPKSIKNRLIADGDRIIKTKHKKYDEHKNFIGEEIFRLEEESKGTRKFLGLSGPIIDTLKKGQVLIIDELDSSLHPVLTQKIVHLFHSNTTNVKNAQLIFTTQDTNFLSKKFFRRDQIWFTEKDRYGATDIYSLVEFKTKTGRKIRKDASYGKDYIAGKYGAIPFVVNTDPIFEAKNNG